MQQTKDVLGVGKESAGQIDISKIAYYLSLVNHQMIELFDLDYYESLSGKKYKDKISAIVGYLMAGWKEQLDPHPLFSTKYYIEKNKDVAEAEMNPLQHYIYFGYKEDRDPHPMFSNVWYKAQYLNGLADEVPLVHYLKNSSSKCCNPNPSFDASWYTSKNSHLIQNGEDPLVHYVRFGASSGLARNSVEHEYLVRQGKSGISNLIRSNEIVIGDTAEFSTEPFPVSKSDLAECDLLTLDIWDTVLRRDCHPDEIKLQSARFMFLNYYWELKPVYRDIRALLKRRTQVENISAPKGDFEYRFSIAASRWLSDILEPGVTHDRMSQIYESVMTHEETAESRSIRVDVEFKKFIDVFSPPAAVYLSDFYLESARITRLLESKGIAWFFLKGYSSCDTYENKRSGALFKKAISDFRIDPKKILHVGDNKHADVDVPQALGIISKHYTQPLEIYYQEIFKKSFDDYLSGDLSRHANGLQQRLDSYAHNTKDEKGLISQGIQLSTIAVSFVMNILETAMRFDVKEIYFFTREGQFLKQLYEKVARCNPYNTKTYPKAKLLEVSRVSTFAASIKELDINELMRLWNQYSKQSLNSFFKSLNFDAVGLKKVFSRHAISLDEVVDLPWLDKRFVAVLTDPAVKTALEKHISDQKKLLNRYLEQEGFAGQGQVSLIVDIGWRGTIQDNLCYMVDHHVHGCYLGLFSYLNKQPSNSSKDGWLADFNKYEYAWEGEEIAPLEMLFNGTGGSVTGYEEIESKVKAVRKVIAAEEKVIQDFVGPIQQGILDSSELICEYVRLHGLIAEDIRGLARFRTNALLNKPSPVIADAFFKLHHNETFGTGTATDMSLMAELVQSGASYDSHKLHFHLKEALKNAHWKAGLLSLPQVKSIYIDSCAEKRLALPVDFRAQIDSKIIGRHGVSPKVAIYAPSPIVGSGGHRTIYNMARRLAKLGMEIYIYLESEGAGVASVEHYLQGTPAHIHIGWSQSVPVDFALATIAHSASYVSQHNCPHKGYLVQDYEAAFNPLSDGYVVAENSYCQGLSHFTIGNWLSHVLKNQFGVKAIAAGLGVDTDIYKPLPTVHKGKAVCFLYQPDKPRRTPDLGIAALRLLKQARPDVTIYVYGSDLPINLDFQVVNLGMIRDLKEINMLYNKCRIGLCISMSNPSRIPYEMMAAGTVPIDLYRYNNLLDHEAGTALLAYQSPISICEAMASLLDDDTQFMARAKRCYELARTKTLDWEQDVFANGVAEMLSGNLNSEFSVTEFYSSEPFISIQERKSSSIKQFCSWQAQLAAL